MSEDKPKLDIERLIEEARIFCTSISQEKHNEIMGVTDGKALGTYIEHKFENMLSEKYKVTIGSSAKGIDLPDSDINTDLKTTRITQPQSSCPSKNIWFGI